MLSIAYYTAIKNIKDVKTLLLIVVLPILLIIILGTALDQYHLPQNLVKSKVAFLSSDAGDAALQFAEFISQGEVTNFLDILEVTDYAEGIKLLDSGEVESFIHLPEGYSESFINGGASIRLISNEQTPVVKGIVENYINRLNGMMAVSSVGGSIDEGFGNYIAPRAITADGRQPRALDYYAVHTLLQVLVIGALFGIMAMREDEDKNTLVRIKSAPIRSFEVIIGRTLANIIILFLQALTVVLFSKYVYQANWGENFSFSLAVIFTFVVLVVGLGMLLGVLIKSNIGSLGTLWGIMIFFAITGGAFGGTVNDTLAQVSPNFHAATAIFNNVFAGSPESIRAAMTVLVSSIVVVYLLTFIVSRRRLA